MHRSIALFVCIFAATTTKTNALSPEVLALSGHDDLMNQNYQGAVDKYQGALDIFQALDANGLLAKGMAQRVSIVTVLNGDQPLSGLDPNYPSTGIKRDRCSDSVQNGDETGVDCGGSCSVCPVDCVFNKTPCTCTPSCDSTCSCTDTITITTPAAGRGQACPSSSTETFTGEACPTCSDSVQNQDETGVDCGGTCAACATCSDSVQNQDETGVDCGGTCTACAPTYTNLGGGFCSTTGSNRLCWGSDYQTYQYVGKTVEACKEYCSLDSTCIGVMTADSGHWKVDGAWTRLEGSCFVFRIGNCGITSANDLLVNDPSDSRNGNTCWKK